MTSISRSLSIAVTALCLNAAANYAYADLLSKDYVFGSGDNWITRDTSTKLEWLDVSLTVSQNFDQVRTGVWYQRGFRYATKAELEALFQHAGTPDDNFNLAHTYPRQTLALAELLGPTRVSPYGVTVMGLTGTDFFGNPANYPVGMRFSALLGKIDYIDLGSQIIGEAHFSGGHPFSDQASPNYGSFLVRAVPEPASALLLACGLAVLAANRKRNQKTQAFPDGALS